MFYTILYRETKWLTSWIKKNHKFSSLVFPTLPDTKCHKCLNTFSYFGLWHLMYIHTKFSIWTNFAYYRNFLMSSCFQFVLNVKIFGTYSIILGPNHSCRYVCMYSGVSESSWIWFSSLVDHPLGKLKFQILICSRFTRYSVALCLPNHDQYYGLGHHSAG